MNINWFTVIAQLLNFLILAWLLKKFLYKPVLDAIDAREKRIAARLQDAKAKQEDAIKEKDEFFEKNKQFDGQKKELLEKAIADAQVQKDKLIEAARKEVNALHTKQQKALKDQQENLERDLAQKLQQQVFDISRKALADMASVSLEEQTTNLFISRLEALKDDHKQQFIDAFRSGTRPILIQTAFDLPKNQQKEIMQSVGDILGKNTEFEFKTAPGMISGIELTTNGYKLAWSISAYLDSLRNTVSKTIQENEQPAKARN